MDVISAPADVASLVRVSAVINSLCFQYLVAVKGAKRDVERVRGTVSDIAAVLGKIKQLLEGRDAARLSTAQDLFDSLGQCLGELEKLEAKLEPTKTRKAMSRCGVRALKWPLSSGEVAEIVSGLERYQRTFALALQIDQTGLMLDFDRRIDVAAQHTQSIHHKFDLAKLPIASGASFDSHAEEHNARCLPGTRTDLLHQIGEWARSKDGKVIFWLSGMAGTGKSTIARTIAQSLAIQGQLGASFFFKKGEGDRGNASRFFSTIATDLGACERGMRSGMRRAIDDDPAISERALADQFEKLILHPLREIQQNQSQARTRIIVIDALDECEREEDVRAILQLLARTKDIRTITVRVLVTSRPELPIRLSFKQMPDGTYQDLFLHKVQRSTVERDIRLFLEHELGLVRAKRSLSAHWPRREQVQALVELAVPLFIYAATVCRYVSTEGSDPEEHLNKVLEYRKSSFSQLDRVYLPVLDQLLDRQEEEDKEIWLQAFRELVGGLVVLESPLSVASLAGLFRIPPKQIRCRLDSLHSVLRIPYREDIPVGLLHLSFREFLVSPQKEGKSPFWVDERATHERLASRCLELMSSPAGLRQDMCNLTSPGTLRAEVDDGTVARSLPPELQYACRYFVHHLEQSRQQINDGDSTHLFLQKHFLHWLEAMGLIEETNKCISLLEKLQAHAESSASATLAFLHDAQRFTLRFRSILADAPLQIYPALIFAPELSTIRQNFVEQAPKWVEMLSGRESQWDACCSTLEGHSEAVLAVAFSPDGKVLASASWDKTVKLWDSGAGAVLQTLEGHSDNVNAVAFSPDGKLLASASRDNTVKLWDSGTGAMLQTLEDHSDEVSAVAFSPDDKVLASASRDNTVKLWDSGTGAMLQTLDDHSDEVTAVAFSPDGKMLASASWDDTVKLWASGTGAVLQTLERRSSAFTNVAFSPDGQMLALALRNNTVKLWASGTGAVLQTLKGHSDTVLAVAFSPDGKLLASASWDKTVKLWDSGTGAVLQTLEGHSDTVLAVAFSPDGKLLASASWDNTVKLWASGTGTVLQTIERQPSTVNNVAFSPDGKVLASASGDNAVKLWASGKGAVPQTLEGHSNEVKAVAFSPDGKVLASASEDNTIKLWASGMGAVLQTLEGHSSAVDDVTFSPDGKLLASASKDTTVKLWDSGTGAMLQTLEDHSDTVNAVAFSPGGKLLASASWDKTIKLWASGTGAVLQTLEGHSEVVLAVAFSPDGKMLASASGDNTVKLWASGMGAVLQTLKGHSDTVLAVAFSPDGKMLASASWDNTVKLWASGTGAVLQTLRCAPLTRTLLFSEDMKVLETDQGTFHLTHFSDDETPPIRNSCQMLVTKQWVRHGGKNLLWLPTEYRARYTDTRGCFVALGQVSGRVTILKFSS